MKDKILKWAFECDDTGASSKTMAAYFSGVNGRYKSHPLDPSDFNRCLKFLKWVPEARLRLDELKKLNEKWSVLIDKWEELENMFLDEVGFDWGKGRKLSAEKTYKFMKELGL